MTSTHAHLAFSSAFSRLLSTNPSASHLPKQPQEKLVCGLKEIQVTVSGGQLSKGFPRLTFIPREICLTPTYTCSNVQLYIQGPDNLPARLDSRRKKRVQGEPVLLQAEPCGAWVTNMQIRLDI